MKKIFFSLVALITTVCASAQVVEVYENGTLTATYTNTTSTKYKVIFKEASDEPVATEPQAGDNVVGTTTINGTTYTKAVVGTVADYVDLGIKDSNGKAVLWATHNLGASKPEEYGAYIAWGENGTAEEGYSSGVKTAGYSWSKLHYCTGTNYKGPFDKYVASSTYGTVDDIYTLESEDDAATVNWGSSWRTPSYTEWIALTNTSNFTWTYDSTNRGFNVTSKISGYEGNSIFLPEAGSREDSTLGNAGTYACYWSSTLYSSKSCYAYGCKFYDSSSSLRYYNNESYRYNGFSIRPVRSE